MPQHPDDWFEGREAADELAGPRAMTDLALVALGGCVGATLRYLVDAGVTRAWGSSFPWSTLAINIVGAFALGLLTVATLERGVLPDFARPAFGVGVLGAFTTFSTFAVEAIALAEGGQLLIAAGYVLATNVVGIAAAFAGFALGRSV